LGLYCSSESKPLAGDWSLATVIAKVINKTYSFIYYIILQNLESLFVL
jgi:hypothetical protein